MTNKISNEAALQAQVDMENRVSFSYLDRSQLQNEVLTKNTKIKYFIYGKENTFNR